jgi:hypothetical protein
MYMQKPIYFTPIVGSYFAPFPDLSSPDSEALKPRYRVVLFPNFWTFWVLTLLV